MEIKKWFLVFIQKKTQSLIKNSEITLTFGTSSVVESLLSFKPTLEIGKTPRVCHFRKGYTFLSEKNINHHKIKLEIKKLMNINEKIMIKIPDFYSIYYPEHKNVNVAGKYGKSMISSKEVNYLKKFLLKELKIKCKIKKKKICFLTLAKGNNNRLKNKNILSFSGRPLIYWTISKIKKISKNYYINSDSEFILNYAKKLKVKTIRRKPELCGDDIPSRHLMLDSLKNFPKNTYAVIHVQANSPNLNFSTIKKVYDIFMYTDIDDVFSISSSGKING